MSIEVYAMNLKNFLDEPTEKYLHLFSQKRREKILSYKFNADRIRTIFAELLARSVIAKKISQPIEKIFIDRDENGKPYVVGDFFKISISHSKNWAAVSIGEVASGIDVEEDFSAALEIAQNFFCPNEYFELINLPENIRGEKFLCMWTLKESYFKLSGDEDFLQVDHKNICGKNFFPSEGVVISCCAEKFSLPKKIVTVYNPSTLF